ncbi:MAG: hypothetical protein QFB86_03610 [Patescibacteria group bacterium]|nr:hypothetical protein [Patescibacteria group bacterium]
MYSGSTFNAYSGHVLGAHQRIDRIARRQLNALLPNNSFPKIKTILRFEGNDGPDGVKRKSPAKDEPWHYIQPFDLEDTQLIDLIEDHYARLVSSLQAKDEVRAAFEAAWLAHAIVDGLTPAHHYPYEEKLVELRSGRGIEDRTTLSKKLLMPGSSASEQVKNNWKMWGPKGLFTTHAAFEAGFAIILAPLDKYGKKPTADRLANFEAKPLAQWFREQAQHVARMELYDAFYKTGWTIPLARRIRNQLVPELIQSVALVWYGAALEAEQLKVRK